MIGQKNLLTACFAALLALGLAACGTTGDDAAPAATMDDDTPVDDDTPEPELTTLEGVQKAAADAATDADGFATAAETDATNAADAAMGRARFQTTPSSYAHAYDAKEHAGYARTDAGNALIAAVKAAAATTIDDAVRALVEAETARDSAETHGGHVKVSHDGAMEVAANEVFGVEGGHKVGDTTIMTDAGKHSVTVNKKTTVTGVIDKIEKSMVGDPLMPVVQGRQYDPENDIEAVVPMAAVALRSLEIGKTIDSTDDTARLMLVTAYAGLRMEKVFGYSEPDPVSSIMTNGRTGTVRGEVITFDVALIGVGDENVDDETKVTPLDYVGMFYLAGNVMDSNGLGEAVGDGLLAADDNVVAKGAEAMAVYSYSYDTTGDPVTVYLVYDSQRKEGDTTTYVYREVDIHVTVVAVAGNEEDFPAKTGVVVMASLPDTTDYKHINFGVWAGLGEAEKSGSQAIADLGIGFVQSIGDGMTGDDMPNHGDATYTGDWVAAVQKKDEDGNGMIELDSGAAKLMADFEDGDFTAVLDGLATLKGDITGNTFTGDSASFITHDDLDAGADFTGEFNGAFFGSKAAEAGGVFSFATEDNEGGAFTGAFGGRETKTEGN